MTVPSRAVADTLSPDTGEHLVGLAMSGQRTEVFDASTPDPARQLLALQRELAERRLNAVRAVVLLLLTAAALLYAPNLTPGLNRANVIVLA